MPVTGDTGGYTAGKYALELDGLLAGWLSSAEGGNAVSDVVEEKVGADYVIRKHLAGVRYTDVAVTCGTGMSHGFYEWIQAMVSHGPERKSGALVVCDYNLNEVSRLSFTNAIISEVGFPALDAASKDVARMTIKLAPEYTRRTASSGAVLASNLKNFATQKKWLPSNFRLTIDGLDCTRVNKIEALTIKQAIAQSAVGETRDYTQAPSHLEVPDLVVTLAESHAGDFYAWHEDFLIKGNNGADREKNAKLEYLTPDLRDVLFTLSFHHLGVYGLQEEKVEPGSENIRRVRAHMYCEEIEFGASASVELGGPAASPPSRVAAAPTLAGPLNIGQTAADQQPTRIRRVF